VDAACCLFVFIDEMLCQFNCVITVTWWQTEPNLYSVVREPCCSRAAVLCDQLRVMLC